MEAYVSFTGDYTNSPGLDIGKSFEHVLRPVGMEHHSDPFLGSKRKVLPICRIWTRTFMWAHTGMKSRSRVVGFYTSGPFLPTPGQRYPNV